MLITHAKASNSFVQIAPLCQADRDDLGLIAQAAEIWTHWPRDMAPAKWDETFDFMLSEQAAGRWLFHTVRSPDGGVLGQTCYLAIAPEHARVEIGGTWYKPSAQGTHVNPACKLILLEHAFACGAQRVELKTDAANARSRAAILKMGAAFEGIHRQHMLRPNGTWRDTAWYSVLKDEWPEVRLGLKARLDGDCL